MQDLDVLVDQPLNVCGPIEAVGLAADASGANELAQRVGILGRRDLVFEIGMCRPR